MDRLSETAGKSVVVKREGKREGEDVDAVLRSGGTVCRNGVRDRHAGEVMYVVM